MERQGIFDRDEPPHLHVIISEAALYLEVGGPAVLREQLEQLVHPDAPWILQVMPDMAGAHSGTGGPVILLEFGGDEAPIAFADSAEDGTVVDDSARVTRYQRKWERMTAEALSPSMSAEMIRCVIAELPEA